MINKALEYLQREYLHNLDMIECLRRDLYDVVYAAEDGVPYLTNELGSLPPAELVRERAVRRALLVPGVASATVELTEFAARTLHGRIRVTTDEGESVNVTV